ISRPIPRPAPVTKATLDSDMPRILACAGFEGNHRAWPAILLTVGVGIGQVIAWLVRGAPEQRNQGPVCFIMKAAKIPRFATTVIAVVGAASLCIAPMTFAQSGEGATPSTSESDTILGPPTSAADELSGPPASAADDPSTPPASHTDWEEVPETN